MKAIVDPKAGFCGGVHRAIELAERALAEGRRLAVKGELIHNRLEVERLNQLGLKPIEDLKEAHAHSVLVRTHGEEGEFFNQAKSLEVELLDATCPKVKRSQKVIRQAFKAGKQIVIVGHLNHPEVIALQGHCDSRAIVVNRQSTTAPIDPGKPTLLIAQTTVAPEVFGKWQEELRAQIKDLEIFDSRCSFVTRRQKELVEFAARHPAIIFVGGKNSSNSNLLFNICREVNANTSFVEDETELDPNWLKGFHQVGITGSASTPMWLLERVAATVRTLRDVQNT
ncbi:MAG: 4-hydroxy-3-methylbut-2-enyl diphosphate reductase [bacterium]|nr:4-hydroxy-3-methylbut-2-enyl diphosphate reductase [bacterium]